MSDILTVKNHYSILFPKGNNIEYKVMSDVTWHDLGFDTIVNKVTSGASERSIIMRIMTHMCDDPETACFRIGVFEDILSHPKLRSRITELLDHVKHMLDFSSMRRTSYDDSASIWDLMHRLDDIYDYILTVEAIHDCLSEDGIVSEGLNGLRRHTDEIFEANGFAQLKEDIMGLRATTSTLRSVTLGINLNSRFEAESIGLVSINRKPFTKAPLLSGFTEAISHRDNVNDSADWDDDYSYHPILPSDRAEGEISNMARARIYATNPLMAIGMTNLPDSDPTTDSTRYLDRLGNHMLFQTTRKLREVLDRYVTISVYEFTSLIPEFMYYIRWAEFVLEHSKKGYLFAPASVNASGDFTMDTRGFYNMKLINESVPASSIVHNDLYFDDTHELYLLTGANRGGKTTVTQAIGQMFVLAQGGIRVPGTRFAFKPVDCIYTHFPADEEKTMDLGRLGEECTRFRTIFDACTSDSLLLLNETFSTTSFEEGYYIAFDAVRALLSRGIRTIFNTHMHKLAFDIDKLNGSSSHYKAASLTVVTGPRGERSYRIELAPPGGTSYAGDIAEKYGVTYEQLTEGKDGVKSI